MISRVTTAALLGIDAYKVELEVDLARSGMPSFTMVGLAEGAVRESKERVMSALKNSGFKIPPARITVNLAPANMRKDGAGYDLPLALGLLRASESVAAPPLDGLYLAGELSLSGDLKPITGVLPLALKARDDGARALIVPEANVADAAVVEGLDVYGIGSLQEAVRV